MDSFYGQFLASQALAFQHNGFGWLDFSKKLGSLPRGDCYSGLKPKKLSCISSLDPPYFPLP